MPSSNPGRKSHADPLWEHFALNNPIKQGSSALDKSYFVREFLCLGLSEALADSTLLTEFTLVRLPRSLSSALLALCLEFYQ